MTLRLRPRSIRRQFLLSMILIELVSLVVIVATVSGFGSHVLLSRIRLRLESQCRSLASEGSEAIRTENLRHLHLVVQDMGRFPGVERVRISDARGHVQYSSQGDRDQTPFTHEELAVMSRATAEVPVYFSQNAWKGEVVMPIYAAGTLRGFAWVEADQSWNLELLYLLARAVGLFFLVWLIASGLMLWRVSQEISWPLQRIMRATRALTRKEYPVDYFPLLIETENEISELARSLNQMVLTQRRQREGLDDTLSLLDSMLAHAPIGMVFFDQRTRIIRANPVFARMAGVSATQQTGQQLREFFCPESAQQLEQIVHSVFFNQQSEHDHEVAGTNAACERRWTWLVHAYPVWSGEKLVRWVGMIVLDITERRQAQDALRKSEKLAATGRLAASVAHEVNNPLEAITNLLFLLKNHSQLDESALRYVEMAEHEAQRIAEITQQTLRFYRQPTRPTHTNIAELFQAVLNLYRGRIHALNVAVEMRCEDALELFCLSGELRQVFANLVGNALDASNPGGRLWMRARRSRNWKQPEQQGVRFSVADNGSGMTASVLGQIYEAFFTTKEDTGTGLGLWVSHEIVQKHGGRIQVRSRVSQDGESSGTVFHLFFPDGAEEVVSGETATAAQAS